MHSSHPPRRSLRALFRSLRAPFYAALMIAPALSGCGPSSTPTADFATGPTPPSALGLAAGSRVQVNRNGQFYPATVLREVGAGRFMVRYDGAGPEYDEAVGSDRIRADPANSAGATRDYRAGEKVMVTVQNRLALADVVQQISAEMWRVHYDGFGPEVAENVGPDRLRRPYSGPATVSVGQKLLVYVQGRPMPAVVMALVAADRWLVRFDGYGSQYDQAIGAEALQGPVAAVPPPVAAPPVVTPPVAPPPVAPPPVADKGKDKPAKDKPPEPIAVPAGPLQAGEAVVVMHRGALHRAQLVGPGAAPGSFKVKYDDPAASTPEEDVAGDRVTRAPTIIKGAAYTQNQRVFIEWHGMLFPGKVVKESGKGQYKVRYENHGPEHDEVVIAKRLRPRP